MHSRRQFLSSSALGLTLAPFLPNALLSGLQSPRRTNGNLRFGLVTYLWGADLDLESLIHVCEQSGMEGVELRTEHAHGVEPRLSANEREGVKQRFADSSVELVGYGSNAQFHEADQEKLQQNIDLTKDYVRLMRDCGGSGVKVKPNGFVDGVPREQTIEQIGNALNEVAAFGEEFGQTIRLEAHGRGTSELPHLQSIMEVADHPNVGVCWNSNGVDVEGEGLVANFARVQDRLADTVHIRELNVGDYPYPRLFELFNEIDYSGWILLEARTRIDDKVQSMSEQRQLFDDMTDETGV